MRHVAAHRLAELAAGRLVGRAAARVRVHLDGCDACRGAWERVRSARASFADIGGAPAPELKWDRMRAQVYWTMGSGAFAATDTARMRALEQPARRWPWLAVPALAAAAAVLAVWAPWQGEAAPTRDVVAVPAPVPAPVRAIPVEIAPAALTGVITLIEGDAALTRAGEAAELVDADAIGAASVGTGARLSTGEGRVALQLGAGSVATVGARSALVVARFDEAAIELVLDGELDLEITRRAPGQRFAVIAGGRVVEVRGTAFRVSHRDGEVAVACEHGRVAVSSGDATVEVGAGQALAVSDAEPLLGRAPRPLGDAELASLVASRAAALPMWTDPATVLRTTAPLAVVAPRMRAVRVDGVVVGKGPVWMRVAPGRHLVEAEQAPGRFSPARWVEVGAGPSKPLLLAEAPPPPAVDGTRAGRAARRAELARVLDQGRLRTCVRALEKQGIAAGTHVDLELGVDANGAIRFLNIADTDLPARTAGCVRDAVAAARLGTGAAATWRHRISF